MTNDSIVLLEKKNNIAIVTLNRPEKHNGLNLPMFKNLIKVAKTIKKDKSIRAVVLQGNGPSFCAGLDFPSVAKSPAAAIPKFLKWPWKKANTFQEVAWIWRTLPMPVIAAIHGNCFGGGIQIALAADFRFASADSQMSVMEMKWGLIPDMTGSVSLNELLPLDKIKDLAMTGRTLSGSEANDMNLVTWLSSEPKSAALKYAELLATKSPDTVRACKALFTKNRHASESDALSRERMYQLWMFATPNQRVALKAGMKKIDPEFKERFM